MADDQAWCPKPTNAVRKALLELIEDDLIVFIEELDPSTGKLRKRYFIKGQEPKSE